MTFGDVFRCRLVMFAERRIALAVGGPQQVLVNQLP